MKLKSLTEPKPDGRKARSLRSREAVVQAMLAFVREGNPVPSAAEIAHRAKVSRRVVFNQFKDIESLRAACLARIAQEENAKFWQPISPDLPLPERLEAFVGARSDRLEHVTAFRRASMALAPLSPRIAEAVRAGAARAHAEVKAVFDPEIRRVAPAARPRFATQLIAACSWPLWDLLRQDLNLGQRRAREAMAALVAAVIERELRSSKRRQAQLPRSRREP